MCIPLSLSILFVEKKYIQEKIMESVDPAGLINIFHLHHSLLFQPAHILTKPYLPCPFEGFVKAR